MKKPSTFEIKLRFDCPLDISSKEVVGALMRAVRTQQFGLHGRLRVDEIRKLKEGV